MSLVMSFESLNTCTISSLLSLLSVVENVSPELPTPTAMPVLYHHGLLTFWNFKSKETLFFFMLPWL